MSHCVAFKKEWNAKLPNLQLKEENLRMKQRKERRPTLGVCEALIERKNGISIPPRRWGIAERLNLSKLMHDALLLFHLGGEICSRMFASSVHQELLMISVRLKEKGSKDWLQLDILTDDWIFLSTIFHVRAKMLSPVPQLSFAYCCNFLMQPGRRIVGDPATLCIVSQEKPSK